MAKRAPRATKRTVEERVQIVTQWIAMGMSHCQIRDAAAAEWGIRPKSANMYMGYARARAREKSGGKENMMLEVGRALLANARNATKLCGAEAVEHPDFQARNDAWGRYAKLFGLNSPEKLEVESSVKIEDDVLSDVRSKREQALRPTEESTGRDSLGPDAVRGNGSRANGGPDPKATNGKRA